MNKVINSNLLSINEGVIIHQLNCQHKMGAGIAKSIRHQYPKHYYEFMNDYPILGNLLVTNINDYFSIIGIYAQLYYGNGRLRNYTNYKSFQECLLKINKLYISNPNIKYYMPYGIGCGNAGGNWSTISKIIEVTSPYIILVKL